MYIINGIKGNETVSYSIFTPVTLVRDHPWLDIPIIYVVLRIYWLHRSWYWHCLARVPHFCMLVYRHFLVSQKGRHLHLGLFMWWVGINWCISVRVCVYVSVETISILSLSWGKALISWIIARGRSCRVVVRVFVRIQARLYSLWYKIFKLFVLLLRFFLMLKICCLHVLWSSILTMVLNFRFDFRLCLRFDFFLFFLDSFMMIAW